MRDIGDDYSQKALEAAVQAIVAVRKPESDQTNLKEMDPRRLALFQLHQFNLLNLRRVKKLEEDAIDARIAAQRAARETENRLEIIDIELGIDEEGNSNE